jgi:hypothetical protein
MCNGTKTKSANIPCAQLRAFYKPMYWFDQNAQNDITITISCSKKCQWVCLTCISSSLAYIFVSCHSWLVLDQMQLSIFFSDAIYKLMTFVSQGLNAKANQTQWPTINYSNTNNMPTILSSELIIRSVTKSTLKVPTLV